VKDFDDLKRIQHRWCGIDPATSHRGLEQLNTEANSLTERLDLEQENHGNSLKSYWRIELPFIEPVTTERSKTMRHYICNVTSSLLSMSKGQP